MLKYTSTLALDLTVDLMLKHNITLALDLLLKYAFI